MGDTYRVVVTREGDYWLAGVPALQGAHTFARSLESLDRFAREVIILAAGLPDDAAGTLELEWELHTGDPGLDGELDALRRERQQADAQRRRLEERTAQYAARLGSRGFSVRDIGALLGVSRARAHQLVTRESAP